MTCQQFEVFRNRMTCLVNAIKEVQTEVAALPGGGALATTIGTISTDIAALLAKETEAVTELKKIVTNSNATNTSLTAIGNGINEVKTKNRENAEDIINKLDEVSQKISQLILKFP